jgi:DinB superfamily
MAGALTPPLDQIHSQLEAAASRARTIVEGLSPALLGRRPDQDAWSVAECIAHLSLTTDAYVPAIRQALDEGRAKHLLRSGTSFRMGIPARLLAWWLEPPYRLRSKTPAAFVPGVENPANALPDFLHRQQQLLILLAEADGLALDRLQIPSPFARQMRYNVYAAFRLIAVHQRRHLWQAEQTAKAL